MEEDLVAHSDPLSSPGFPEAPRPDNVLALAVPLRVETSVARPGGDGNVSGFAIALGWNTPQKSSAYLISDDVLGRPVWVGEADLLSNSVRGRAEV